MPPLSIPAELPLTVLLVSATAPDPAQMPPAFHLLPAYVPALPLSVLLVSVMLPDQFQMPPT